MKTTRIFYLALVLVLLVSIAAVGGFGWTWDGPLAALSAAQFGW